MGGLSEQMKALQNRLARDSHLLPSSVRFGRKPKSLRPKSEKQSGGRPRHPGSSLQFSSAPDEIIERRVKNGAKRASTTCTRWQRVEESGDRSWICRRRVRWCGNSGQSRTSVPTPLPPHHHSRISRRSAGSHPLWTQGGGDRRVSGRTAIAAPGPYL